jgi:acetyl esterase/lipase
VVLSLIVSGCMSVATSLVNAPSYFGKLTRESNLAYGEEAHQRLDIYRHKGWQTGQQRPVLLFIHGGRWTSGKKEHYRFLAARMAKEGFLVVIPDYAKYPEVKFPAMMRDPALALAWTFRYITDYGGDSRRIYVMGHSSGAHMGALLASDSRYLQAYDLSPSAIRAFVGLAGPYAFIPEDEDLKDMFGPPQNYPQMQVPTHIDGDEPPMLLLHGEKDELVGRFNYEKLAEAIKVKGGMVETRLYPNVGHMGIIASFARSAETEPRVARDATRFFLAQEPSQE